MMDTEQQATHTGTAREFVPGPGHRVRVASLKECTPALIKQNPTE